MTVQTQTGKAVYVADGIALSYTIPFYFFDKQIAVYLGKSISPLTEGIDYTVSGAGNPGGGTITFTTVPQSGKTITIIRNVELKQLVTFMEGEKFPAVDFENSLDKIIMALQEMHEKLKDCINIPYGTTMSADDIHQLLIDISDNLNAIKQIPEFIEQITTIEQSIMQNVYTKTETDNKISEIASYKYANITLSPSLICSDTTYEDYPYRLDIPIEEASADTAAIVTLNLADALSGNYAPISSSKTGYVSLFLKEIPLDNITIPSIVLR